MNTAAVFAVLDYNWSLGHGSFSPLLYTVATSGGIGAECIIYSSFFII